MELGCWTDVDAGLHRRKWTSQNIISDARGGPEESRISSKTSFQYIYICIFSRRRVVRQCIEISGHPLNQLPQ